MTEEEWLESNDGFRMFNGFYHELGNVPQISLWKERQMALFTFACCRLIPGYLESEPDRLVLEAAERDLDGGEGLDEMIRLQRDVEWDIRFHRQNHWAAADRATHSLLITLEESLPEGASKQEQDRVFAHVGAELAHMLREIVGNPFRPITLDTECVTPTVVSLAEAAYEERDLASGHLDLDRLGVLSDALEEAGCNDDTILGHLPGLGPHVRGCWVLDRILGKV